MGMETLNLDGIVKNIKDLLKESHVVLPKKGEAKLYHHKGIENFMSVGALFISVIQHDYCKFIVVMLKGQAYPSHYHRIKDETYFILHGDLKVIIEDETTSIHRGDIINVPRRFTHSFSTKNGCVFEEISTAYLNRDSVYEDKDITNISTAKKLTILPLSLFFEE